MFNYKKKLETEVWTPKNYTKRDNVATEKIVKSIGDQKSSWIMNLEENFSKNHKSLRRGRGGGGGLSGDNDKVSVNWGLAVIKKKSIQSIWLSSLQGRFFFWGVIADISHASLTPLDSERVVFLSEPCAASEKVKLCKLMVKGRSFRPRSSRFRRSPLTRVLDLLWIKRKKNKILPAQ